MLSSKNYAAMSLDELVAEEKKLKSLRIPGAVFIGFLVGIAVWAATHQKAGVAFFVLAWVFILSAKGTKTMKNLQAEINRRNTVE